MRIRLRAPGGQSVLSLAEGATIKDLLNAIREQASVSAFDIKYGYPPQQLVLDQEDTSSPISQLKVRLNNETLIISPREDDSNTSTQAPPNTAAVGGDANGVPSSQPSQATTSGPISLKKKRLAEDVPELPLPERGSTLGNVLLSTGYISDHS
jgi:ubiquitin thioesterase OTU1